MGVSLARVGWLCVFKSSCEMLLVAVAAGAAVGAVVCRARCCFVAFSVFYLGVARGCALRRPRKIHQLVTANM